MHTLPHIPSRGTGLWRAVRVILLTIFASLSLFFASQVAANAIDVEDGGGCKINCNAVGTPNNPIPAGPYPGKDHYVKSLNPNNFNYTLPCSNWGGSGSFKPSADCNVTESALFAASGPLRGGHFRTTQNWGTIVTDNGLNIQTKAPQNYFIPATSVKTHVRDSPRSLSCASSGTKSAYAQTWNVKAYQTQHKIVDYTQKKFKNSKGKYYWSWVKVVTQEQKVIGESFSHTKVGCSYPKNQIAPPVLCYWNYDGNGWYSKNRKASVGSWKHYSDRAPLAGDPRSPAGGSGNEAPRCDRTGSAFVRFDTTTPELAYYRLQVTYDWKRFTNTQWVGGGKVLWNNWVAGATQKGSNTNYWAYTCQQNAGNLTEGPWGSQGAIPNRDQGLNSANCIHAKWECEIASPTAIGHDPAQVASGAVNPRSDAYVLRNSEKIPVTMAVVRIVDLTNGGRSDVTNGNSGTAVRNITKIEYRNRVTPGSTPFVGDSNDYKAANNSNQLFQLFKGTATQSSNKDTSFNVWQSGANLPNNINRSMAFQWASDPNSEFSLQREWRVTGEFRIPNGGGIGATRPSAGGSTGYNWIEGTYDCMEYTGTGTNRVKTGRPLIAESNDTTVVRSVNELP